MINNWILGFVLIASLLRYGNCVVETNDLLTGARCGANSRVSGGIVVSHQPFDTQPPIANDIVCFFTMQGVRFRHRLRFMFTHFSLSPMDCSLANVTFYDGTSDTDDVIATICPDTPDVLTREFLSSSFWLTMKLQVSSLSAELRIANFSGFYVSFTEGRNPCADPSLEMMCDNGRCIYEELQCDDLDSCGDNTDERTTAPSFCNGTGTTAETTTRPSSATELIESTPTSVDATVATTGLATTATPVVVPTPVGVTDETTASATTATPVVVPTPVGVTDGTTASATTETPVVASNSLFSDLTPLYIILSLTAATFAVYLIYILLSFQWFKDIMTSCLHHCFLVGIRRRRKWKEANEEAKKNLSRKITPEKTNGSLVLENLSSVDLQRNGVEGNTAAIFLTPNGNGSSGGHDSHGKTTNETKHFKNNLEIPNKKEK